MESLARISASRKTGAEPFTAAGRPVGATVADFWGWSRSDLLDNTERGMLAEFIVATALGVPTDGVREGWAAWDLTTPGGVRVEVKSAAYLQSWAQKELTNFNDAEITGLYVSATSAPGIQDDAPDAPGVEIST